MAYTIHSPAENFTGITEFGGGQIAFNDGEASVSELHPGVRAYMEKHGYVIEEYSEGPFDPADHGVRDVVAYLESVQEDDPEEFYRVYAAERDGKARKSVIEKFDDADAGQGDDSNGGDDDAGGSENDQ